MKTTFVSTPAIANAARLSLMRMQIELTVLNTELSTGRHADVGLELGHRTGRTVSLRTEFGRLHQLMDTNALVATRLESTQAVIGGLTERAKAFVDILIASRDGRVGQHVAVEDATDALSHLTSLLNTSIDGEFLFGGINSDVKPLVDYFASPTSSAKLAVDTAFLTEFGFTQSDPAVATITAVDMDTFLRTSFAGLFSNANWASNWSSASSQNVTSRIAPDTLIESGTNANTIPLRKLAIAFVMMADLGGETQNKETFQTVTDIAIKLAGEAVYELALEQGNIGVKQQRIDRSNQIMSLQIDLLNADIAQFESADPYETSTRINELISQIEVSYAVTGRLQQMSLVRYL